MRFRRRQHDNTDLEAQLAVSRPEPPERLIRQLTTEIQPERRMRVGKVRVALIAACTALVVAAVAAAGGAGTAASGLDGIVALAGKAVSPGSNGQGQAAGRQTPAQNQYKTTICHRTRSAGNPYVEITVSEQGAAQHKANHPEDIVPAPEAGCP